MSRRAKGEGSLYLDDRGRWIGQADAGVNPKTGKRRRVKVTGRPGEPKGEVAKRLRRRIEDLDGSNGGPETVGELVELWISKGMPGQKPKSPSTVAGLCSHAETHVLPVFGDQPLNAVTVDDIEDFLGARVKTLSKSTLIKLKTILSQSFAFGVARRYVSWNPARVALLPADAEQKRYPRALLPTELRSLINSASDHRLGAWVVVTSTLALRPGEVYGLCWDVVDLDAGTVTVRRTMLRDGTLKEGTKTGASGVRTRKMPRETVDALRSHRKTQNEERLLMGDRWPSKWADLVFVSEAGTADAGLQHETSRLPVGEDRGHRGSGHAIRSASHRVDPSQGDGRNPRPAR
jgi:integrase